jgi:hypothetical protein
LKSNGTWEYKKDAPSPPPSSRAVVSDTVRGPFPSNYSGHDAKTLLVQLIDLRKRFVKSEFETTADYTKRIAEEKKQPVLNNLTVQDTFHLVASGVAAEYDADSQTMSFFLPVEKNPLAASLLRLRVGEDKDEIRDLSRTSLYSISLGGYQDEEVFFNDFNGLPLSKKDYNQGFSARINLTVEEARRLKTTTRAILLVQFEEPYAVVGYSRKGQFQTRLIDVQFFDQTTGNVLAKVGATASLIPSSEPMPHKNRLLESAVEFYKVGRDNEALSELQRLVQEEPTNAEAFLLTARIHRRAGDQVAAIAAARAAAFWDSKLIDAYILLARIFLDRGELGEANRFINQTLNIDPTNSEALSLRRQIVLR